MIKNVIDFRGWNRMTKVIVGTILGVVGTTISMINIILLMSMIYRVTL